MFEKNRTFPIRLVICLGLLPSATWVQAQTNPRQGTQSYQKKTPVSRPTPREQDEYDTPPPRTASSKSGTSGSAGRAVLDQRTGQGQRTTSGQASGQTTGQQLPPRPTGQPLRMQRLSPELEQILLDWEKKSATYTRLEGTFQRTTYDSVFQVEFVAQGKYCYQYPDKGSFHQRGVEVPENTPSKKKGFVLKTGQDERWISDGESIMKIDDKEKQFQKQAIPEEDRGQNIRNAPLPFLFGMKASEAKQRYQFELNEEKTNDQQIWLKVIPMTQQDRSNYRFAEVILDRKTFLPMGVKLWDPTGNKQDVYYFPQANILVNRKSWTNWLTGDDPLKPKLTGYKAAVAPQEGIQTATNPPTTRNPATSKSIGPSVAPRRTAEIPQEDEPPVPTRSTGRTKLRN